MTDLESGNRRDGVVCQLSSVGCPLKYTLRRVNLRLLLAISLLLIPVGCAKYNTYFNAKRSFDRAEDVREAALKKHDDPPKPGGAQRNDYEQAIQKAQKVLDEYPGNDLTDDALFLQAKAHHRLESYRQSIRKLDLLFVNYPATPYLEEALYLQGLNYLLIGALERSQEFLERLETRFPDSDYLAATRRVSGDNAFAMKEWATAAASYREYLDLDEDVAERDRVGLKLARCYWELDDYYPAAEILQEVSQSTDSADLAFKSRLLRARVHIHMGDFEIVDMLLKDLHSEAEVYRSSGEVLLVEAEAMMAEGKSEDAAPLLENMPPEWENPTVKARAAEILGNIYLRRGEWDKARQKYQAAMVKKSVLDDVDHTRQLAQNLGDYLAAEQSLVDADGPRAARLRLLQANSLLFGFERPKMAASLYVAAAVDTAAEATVAARAFYGGYLVYDRYLDLPDSAVICRDLLLAEYPESPQAYLVGVEADSTADLFGYLLSLRTEQQAENYAQLTVEELAALADVGGAVADGAAAEHRGLAGVRRRMVYLSRRENIIFPPPIAAVRNIAERRHQLVQEQALAAAKQAEFDSVLTAGEAGTLPAEGPPPVDEFGHVMPPKPVTVDAVEESAETPAAPDDEDAQKKKKKKKQDENWDFLR